MVDNAVQRKLHAAQRRSLVWHRNPCTTCGIMGPVCPLYCRVGGFFSRCAGAHNPTLCGALCLLFDVVRFVYHLALSVIACLLVVTGCTNDHVYWCPMSAAPCLLVATSCTHGPCLLTPTSVSTAAPWLLAVPCLRCATVVADWACPQSS